MKYTQWLILVPLLSAAFFVGWKYGTSQSSQGPKIQNQPLVNKVVAQGRILPRGGLINVLAPPGQRIVSIDVSEGSIVIAQKTELATYIGQEVIRVQSELAASQLDDIHRELDQKFTAAESNKQIAENALLTSKLQLEQASQELDLKASEKQLQASKDKLRRLESLAQSPQTQLYVSKSALEDNRLAIESSQSQLESMQRKQKSAIKGAELAVVLSQKSYEQAQKVLDSIEKLRNQNRSAQLTRKLSGLQVENARLIAPINGTVLKVFGKPGEVVVNSPLMQLADLSNMICVGEVLDRLISKVNLNDKVIISSPALPRPLHGHVIEIGQMIGNGSLIPASPLMTTDRKTADVKIEIEREDNELAQQLVNLQVSIEILTDGAPSLSLNIPKK